jgi:hypothetical protein
MAAMQKGAKASVAVVPTMSPNTTEARFCVDCKFVKSYGGMYYCKGAPRNPVTGSPQELQCNDMRMPGGQCGPEGKLFKAAQ